MATVHIIGHGSSPKGRAWGSHIDEHVVVRLKNPFWQNAEDYGTRCDWMATSTETCQLMLEYKTVPKGYWAQPKRGKWDSSTESAFRAKAKAPLTIPIDIHNRWNPLFRSLTGMTALECPNHSLGMAAITYVCEFLEPDIVLLVGFDNLLDPNLMDYVKADRGKWVTRHDWKAENQLLGHVSRHYGVEIRGFSSDSVTR